jgi:dipeptidyl aminopeptidase/acylaminoacyl peptidase
MMPVVPRLPHIAFAVSLVAAFGPLHAAQQPAPLVLSQLTWFDRAGKMLGRLGPLADHGNLEISPDGSRVAVAVVDRARRTRDIWMYQTASGERQQFTSDPADENWLIFSPDGRRVVVNAFSPDRSGLYASAAGAALPREMVLDDPAGAWPVSWSPDGTSILIVTNSPKTGNDIWTLSLTGDRTPKAYQRTEASENWAAFSPDGRWVAFSSTAASSVPEVYVTRFPTPGQAWRVSADGGSQARWRRDGKELFYVSPDRQLMSAAVTLGADSVKVDRIEPLFALRFPYGAYHSFDVAQDGERFLVNTAIASAGAPQQVAFPFVEGGRQAALAHAKR